jgi:hypothetical protein
MGDLGRIVPSISKSMVIGNGPTLILPSLTGMIRLGSKVICERNRSCNGGTRRLILAAIIVEPFESDEQGIGKSPDVRVGRGRLSLIHRSAARKALIFVNCVWGTLCLKPVLKVRASTRDLKDIEGLPFIVLYVAFGALKCLAHHSEEEIHHGTHVAVGEGGPALRTEFYQGPV